LQLLQFTVEDKHLLKCFYEKCEAKCLTDIFLDRVLNFNERKTMTGENDSSLQCRPTWTAWLNIDKDLILILLKVS